MNNSTKACTRSSALTFRSLGLRGLYGIVLLISSLGSAKSQTLPLGTAFSYQGVLTQDGKQATGLYDFRANLSTSPNGSTYVGTALLQAQGVTNGIFTLSIDFGHNVFNGQQYWLELDVSTNGVEGYTELVPLQPVAPVPYALYAQNAATALSAGTMETNSISASQLMTTAAPLPGQVLAWNGSSLTWSNPTEGTNVTAAAASGATSVASYGAKGDGSDDTLAVASCVAANNWVCFPNSVSNLYVLDFVLIHSNNRLTVSPGVTLKMANGQNHAFVTNNWSGTTNVTIEGGIWDANWQNQSYGQNLSQVFNLEFVTNLLARDITIQQTVTGAVNGNAFRCGTWQDLRFVNVNLKMLCGEGIHLSGPGNNAMIDGTRGVTSGDFVALDAADSVRRYPQYDSMGPICNVKVENTYFESGPYMVSAFAAANGQVIHIQPGLGAGVTNIFIDGLHGQNYRGGGILLNGPAPSSGVTNGYGDNIHISHVDAWLYGSQILASFNTNSSFGRLFFDHIYSPHSLNTSGMIEISDGNYSDLYVSECSVSTTNALSTSPMISIFGSGSSTNFNTAVVTNLSLANLHMDGHVIVGNHVQGTAQRIVAHNLVMEAGINAIFNTGSSYIWADNISGRYSGPVLLVAGGGTNRIVAGGFSANTSSMSLSGVSSVVCLDSSVGVDGTTVTPNPGDHFYNLNVSFGSGIGWYTAGSEYYLPISSAAVHTAAPSAQAPSRTPSSQTAVPRSTSGTTTLSTRQSRSPNP